VAGPDVGSRQNIRAAFALPGVCLAWAEPVCRAGGKHPQAWLTGIAGKLGKFVQPDEEMADSTGEFFKFAAEAERELGSDDTYGLVSLKPEPASP
jgi:hypothetical protein